MNLNRATIIGNLTRDPESRVTNTGQNVCNFSVATSSQWTDAQGQRQERSEFHPIVAWGKLADICSQYLAKGRKVYVEGRLQTREWEAQDGSKRQRTEIVAENVILLDRPPQGGAPRDAAAPSGTVDQGIGDQEIKVEDIPF
ncbi:MAG: single-stranded DNA-binding protein [Patescibacteria group bacterium]|nr:single-stranded DNA-binding protein [Patescibacteria group bacterium]